MDTTGLLAELVATNTASGDPAPQRSAMNSIQSLLRAHTPALTVEGDADGVHPWMLMTNDAPPEATRLMFACHVDTVPPGDLKHWQFDPFA